MSTNMSALTGQRSVNHGAGEGTWVGLRATRDGALIQLPWVQALVMEGVVFGIHAGSVTTPIAGHAAIDADQPEAAAWVPTGTVMIPLSIRAAMETGATTLAQGGMMAAVSGIAVGAGASTAATPFNLNMSNPTSTNATAATAYTGNGTDPLTAGNFLELARVSGNFDADAAGQGAVYPTLSWAAMTEPMPLVYDAGSILLYGEAAANTLFGTLIWGELSHAAIN